jgi:hypothetical protein
MQQSIHSPTQSAHFLDHQKGILYLESGKTFKVGRPQSIDDIHNTIDRIKQRFTQSGIIGSEDIITAAL